MPSQALDRFEDAAAQAAEAVRRDPGGWRNFAEQARVLEDPGAAGRG